MAEGGYKIKVTEAALQRAAENVSNQVGEMRSVFNELGRVVSGTSRYWIGKAGDSRRQMYDKGKERAEEMLRYLEAYPPDLLKMLGIYVEGEKTNAEAPAALSADVIL